MSIFPSDDFNPTIYRNRYFDLAELDDMQLIDHYRDYGINENRVLRVFQLEKSFYRFLLINRLSSKSVSSIHLPSIFFGNQVKLKLFTIPTGLIVMS